MINPTLGYLSLDAAPADTVDAAAAAGFGSVGIRITGRRIHDDYTRVIGNPAAIRDIKDRLAGGGVRLSNISAYHVFPDVTPDHLERVVDTAAELGAGIIVANSYNPDEGRFLELYARYCELAAAHGIRVAIEFMRYSAIKTIGDVSRVVSASGQPNAGYLIDPLHLERSGGTAADIAAVDPARIIFVQLCDATRTSGEPTIDELRTEARTGRLFPGDGDLPLHDFLDAIPPGTEVELEVPRPENAGLPLAERAAIVRDRCAAFLSAHAARTKG